MVLFHAHLNITQLASTLPFRVKLITGELSLPPNFFLGDKWDLDLPVEPAGHSFAEWKKEFGCFPSKKFSVKSIGSHFELEAHFHLTLTFEVFLLFREWTACL